MPLTYNVDSSLDVVFETWTGTVTGAGLRRAWTRLMSDPAVHSSRRHLADLREAEFALTGADVEAAVREILLPHAKQPWYSAIVVADPVSYGTSRQFQVFAQAGIQTAIFEDRDAALTWLLER